MLAIKAMKRISLRAIGALLALFFITSMAAGQTVERTSELPVVGKVLARLQGAIEWEKLGGTWYRRYTALADLELRTMDLNGTNYAVLSVDSHEGAYRYPEIKVDFMVWTVSNHFLFDKSKLAEVLPENVEFNKSYAVYFEPVLSASGMLSIEKEIYYATEKTKKQKTANLMMAVFPVVMEGRKMVRYFLKISPDGAKPEFKPSDFDSKYYETDYEKFYKFINLGKKPPKDKSDKGRKN